MAVLRYITLNGRRYRTSERKFKPTRNKAQQINVTVGGSHTSQLFGFTDQRWSASILVRKTEADSNYGTVADLITAYALAFCTFIDQFGTNQGNAFIEGQLDLPYNFALIDEEEYFIVELSLTKKQ